MLLFQVENGAADMAISQPSISYVRYTAAGDVSMTYGRRSFFMATGMPKVIPANWYKLNNNYCIYLYEKIHWFHLYFLFN